MRNDDKLGLRGKICQHPAKSVHVRLIQGGIEKFEEKPSEGIIIQGADSEPGMLPCGIPPLIQDGMLPCVIPSGANPPGIIGIPPSPVGMLPNGLIPPNGIIPAFSPVIPNGLVEPNVPGALPEGLANPPNGPLIPNGLVELPDFDPNIPGWNIGP